MKTIPLTQGMVTLVDDADFARLAQFKWYARKNYKKFYAARWDGTRVVMMHRLLLGLTDPQIQGDHRDGNSLNNQRYNLRPATSAQNGQNQSVHVNNTSGVRGVSYAKTRGKWQAHIDAHGKHRNLGRFDTFEDAKQARLAAEIKYHGQFSATLSRTNQERNDAIYVHRLEARPDSDGPCK